MEYFNPSTVMQNMVYVICQRTWGIILHIILLQACVPLRAICSAQKYQWEYVLSHGRLASKYQNDCYIMLVSWNKHNENIRHKYGFHLSGIWNSQQSTWVSNAFDSKCYVLPDIKMNEYFTAQLAVFSHGGKLIWTWNLKEGSIYFSLKMNR